MTATSRDGLTRDYQRGDNCVWRRRAGAVPAFDYSDGDVVEDQIAAIVSRAKDLATGSEELASHISDWATAYHLSGTRANLLRPLAGWLAGKQVLEVGAGCGAITRYLGETAGQVLSVEGSARRAAICASRCRDLVNVDVVCDSFQDFSNDARFDVVTLIGVLEYSRRFVAAADPVSAMVQQCAALLRDDGALVVAIENQLGLKYLAGAFEDHVPERFFGINDLYGTKTAATFGLSELRRLFEQAGLGHVEVFAPFPDYKLPSVIVHEEAVADGAIDVEHIVRSVPAQAQVLPYERTFSEEMSCPVFWRNGLGLELANSFLLVASRRAPRVVGPGDPSVWIYSTERRRAYAKVKTLIRERDAVDVRVGRLYPSVEPPSGSIEQVVPSEEPYYRGQPFIAGFYRTVNRNGWTIEDVAGWARPWIGWLADKAARNAVSGRLPAECLDAVPRNFMVSPTGELVPFDLEWKAASELPVPYVVYRGLLTAFRQTASVASPGSRLGAYVRQHGIPHEKLPALAAEVMLASGLSATSEEVVAWMRLESAFQLQVAGSMGAKMRSGTAYISVRRGSLASIGFRDLVATVVERVYEKVLSRMRRTAATEDHGL